MTGTPEKKTGLVRWALLSVGWLSMALGLLGVFLPLLPTTPFLILAAACFLRSSPELHRRILANESLGPYLLQWQQDRSVPPGAKHKAYVLVVVTFAISIWFVDSTSLRIMLAVLGTGVLLFLACLRTASPPANS